jgi:hypothetical protein
VRRCGDHDAGARGCRGGSFYQKKLLNPRPGVGNLAQHHNQFLCVAKTVNPGLGRASRPGVSAPGLLCRAAQTKRAGPGSGRTDVNGHR